MKLSDEQLKLMRIRGLPGYLIQEQELKIEDYISTYTHEEEGTTPLRITKDQQLNWYKAMLQDITHSPYIACISSNPNDMRAKIVGAMLMKECLLQDKEVLWHTLIGGYVDDLRDNTKYWRKKLDVLIIANVTPDSTPNKFEKLRDILELYSDIPRIVLTTQVEPLEFFNTMGIQLNYGFNLKSKRSKALG